MRLQITDRQAPVLTGSDPLLIRAAGFYEDLEARLRIKVLFECVQSGVDLPMPFKLDLWRFDWLRERSLGNIALSAARGAALIVVSMSRANWLPVEMEKWVTAWSRDMEDRPAALMVLLPKPQDGCNQFHPLRERLWQAARCKPTDFFQEFFEPTREEHRLVGLDRKLRVETGKGSRQRRSRTNSPVNGAKQREEHIQMP
jgi:hypothetical protein